MCCVSGRLFLENSKLEHSEDESSVLGQGGSGTVIYRARYQGQPVAVKRFQIKKFKNLANAPAGKQGPVSFLFRHVLPRSKPPATLGRLEEENGRGQRRPLGSRPALFLAGCGIGLKVRLSKVWKLFWEIIFSSRCEPPRAWAIPVISICSMAGTGLARGGYTLRRQVDPLPCRTPLSHLH